MFRTSIVGKMGSSRIRLYQTYVSCVLHYSIEEHLLKLYKYCFDFSKNCQRSAAVGAEDSRIRLCSVAINRLIIKHHVVQQAPKRSTGGHVYSGVRRGFEVSSRAKVALHCEVPSEMPSASRICPTFSGKWISSTGKVGGRGVRGP